MYGTFCLHHETLNLTIQSTYNSRLEANSNLKKDARNFMKSYKGISSIKSIFKKKNLLEETISDGLYFKVSNKYPNRISIYEKESKIDKGFVYNTNKINLKKIMVFFVIEIPLKEENKIIEKGFNKNHDNDEEYSHLEIVNKKVERTSVKTTNVNLNETENLQHGIHVKFVEELKTYLAKRRNSITGKQ